MAARGNNSASELTLDHVKEAIFNGQAADKDVFDVLERMAKDKGELIDELRKSPLLLEKVGGDKKNLERQLNRLFKRSGDMLIHIAAGKELQTRIEKKRGWGGWALDKLKSAALFPIRHPIATGVGAVAVLLALIYFFGPQAVGLGGVAKAAQNAFKDNVLKKISTPTPSTIMEAAKDISATGGLANPAIKPAVESAGKLMIENLETIQKTGIPSETVEAIQGAARSVLNDPTIADPQQAFMNLME